MVSIKVPATSANVGCGFDTLGLAVSLYAKFSFEEIEEELEIIGCEEKYCNKENLIYTSFMKTLDILNKKIKGVRIIVDSKVPNSRGLGSSAVCIVGGIAGAYALTNTPIDKKRILEIATSIEKHPDNVAPAVYGGLCASVMKDDEVITLYHKLDERLVFLALIPDYETKTADARKVLPESLPFSDIIYSLSRLPHVIDALRNYDLDALSKVMGDKLHEPYRKNLIFEYEEVKSICESIDSKAFFISGSGSTLMNIVENKENALLIQEKLKPLKHNWKCVVLEADNNGFVVV